MCFVHFIHFLKTLYYCKKHFIALELSHYRLTIGIKARQFSKRKVINIDFFNGNLTAKNAIKFPKNQCYAKLDSQKAGYLILLITFLKIARNGGQNLLNLKAPNPPAPLAKGEKGKSERQKTLIKEKNV